MSRSAFIRFRNPTLVEETGDDCRLLLAENVPHDQVDAIVDGLLEQIGARAVAVTDAEERRDWTLAYSGTELVLSFEQGSLVLRSPSAPAGCAIHDLQELFAIRANPKGY